MKPIFTILLLFVSNFYSYAGSCEKVSGSFKAVKVADCPYGLIEIKLNEQNNSLSIFVSRDFDQGSGYRLNYIADGQAQIGRGEFEGEKYTASCADNHIRTRGEFNILRHPLVKEYNINDERNLVYQESFEGSDYIKSCELERL